MPTVNNALDRVMTRVSQSIALIPVVISLAMLLLCLFMVSVDFSPAADWLERHLGIVVVSDADNARTILSALVGGVISLAVFSFSMVMVVLTRASATLSPRVIPGLVTKKQHQVCLGVYLGTIIYSLLLIASIHSEAGADAVPGLAVMIAITFGIACLVLFVNFIHSITRSIQVDHIVESIFLETRRNLRRRVASIREDMARGDCSPPDTEQWAAVHSGHTGYFKRVIGGELLRQLEAEDLVLVTLVQRGEFVAKGRPLFRLSRELDDDRQGKLLDCFDYYIEDFADDHFLFGFKLLSEIAVKALSPGINDPGTAMRVLDMLSMLLVEYAQHPGFDGERSEDGTVRVYYFEPDFSRVLYDCLTPIRQYAMDDVMVLARLLDACANVAYAGIDDGKRAALTRYVEDFVAALRVDGFSELDIEQLNRMIELYAGASGQQVDAVVAALHREPVGAPVLK
ncbi:DUF2254 domain-containing protein [Mangrovimicrobium sediminis]|uniref:DUF2254 domain-containing protein n=1 Tax=Mangrovimicrobium sediminis TaxID=2562682 RepID=A0A4Z0LYV4_9GAMM|nr:DUF2254 domain-containing protein [Haliea sp. SAOS-164]TGD72532.1 DUF2254 domain-containing protein [Haliea sp. SAOS-164]